MSNLMAGDCCPCTCVDGAIHSCSDSQFDCLYPDCGENPAGFDSFESQDNGRSCNAFQDSPLCDNVWDECCSTDCEDFDYYCDTYRFNCSDPACIDPTIVAEFPGCSGDWSAIGDTLCLDANNNPSCGYDGGDVSCFGFLQQVVPSAVPTAKVRYQPA